MSFDGKVVLDSSAKSFSGVAMIEGRIVSAVTALRRR
jgi:hypothetical protein